MTTSFNHIMTHTPVLKNEVIKYLINEDEISRFARNDKEFVFVDGTIGGGGHSLAIAKKYSILNLAYRQAGIKYLIIGIDRDQKAIEIAKKNLSKYKTNIKFINDSFSNYSQILENLRMPSKNSAAPDMPDASRGGWVDAVLLDLGISSMQIDNQDRGFSFKNEKADLDMRMDLAQKLSAKDILNTYSENELLNIFQNSGERFYKKIVRNIIEFRKGNNINHIVRHSELDSESHHKKVRSRNKFGMTKKGSINTVGDLLEIISQSIPEKFKHGKTHFATNIFRALRMEVNSELREIETAMPQIIESLKPGGRLAIITFHSTEDRLVKGIFNELADPCKCPKKYPCVCGKQPVIKKIAKLKPGDKEVFDNPRSRSAILRVAERI